MFAMQRNRAGPKFENSKNQKLNVPRKEEEHSNPSHEHAAKAAGKNRTSKFFFDESFLFCVLLVTKLSVII